MGKAGSDVEPLLSPELKPAENIKYTKSSLKARWLILLLSSFLLFGNYYCFDNPAALKEQFKDYFHGTSVGGSNFENNFSLMYSVYSFPNTILPFFGGFLVDKLGVKMMTLVFAGCILLGQCIFAFGTSIKSLPVMLLGRVVFGFGGESVTVATSTLLAIWFADAELALALGINLGVSRLGAVANNVLSPIFWDENHIALWMGAIICAASFMCGVGLASIDKIAEKTLKAKNVNYVEPEVETEPPIKLTDLLKFRLPFWLLSISCLVIYGTVIPFNNNASTFLQTRDFMKNEFPWKDNVSFVAPLCDGAAPEPDNMVTRSCGVNGNVYLGPAYLGVNFVNSSAVVGTKVTMHCANGYIPISKAALTAECVATSGDDDWQGDSYWNVTSGAGCRPNTTALQCDTAQLEYLHASATNATSNGCYKGNLQCLSSYTLLHQDLNYSGACAANCDKTTGYLWEVDGGYHNPCVPQLFQATSYCKNVNDAEAQAGTVMSIPYFTSIVLSPILGFGVDMLGKRALLATFASIALIGVHLSLAITTVAPYAPLVGQGVAYSIFAAALWPSVPYAVEAQYIGTANGVMTSIQNSGLAVFPIILAAILNPCAGNPPKSAEARLSEDQYNYCESTYNNYKYAELFFVGLAGFGTLIGIWLTVDDIIYRKSILHKSHVSKAPAADKADDDDETLLSVQRGP